MTAPKIPMNLFAIPFGLAGLGEAWSALSGERHAPALVADVILLVSAACWLVLVAAHLRYLVTAARTPWAEISADLLDPILAPFTSLVLITPILLASDGLFPQAAMPGRVVTDVFIALTVLLAGWFVGQWFVEPLDLDRYHPGYFLPTVAGSLVASQGAALVGQQRLAEVLLGSGVISWIVVGSLIMGRLFFRPLLPPALQPTMAIEVAPAAVASLTWFAIHGARIDMVIALFGGYGVLMLIAQLRLLPVYLRLTFMPSMWSFTFSWAAVAAAAIIWLQSAAPRRDTASGSTSSSPRPAADDPALAPAQDGGGNVVRPGCQHARQPSVSPLPDPGRLRRPIRRDPGRRRRGRVVAPVAGLHRRRRRPAALLRAGHRDRVDD
jgi:tellurite resistance protein